MKKLKFILGESGLGYDCRLEDGDGGNLFEKLHEDFGLDVRGIKIDIQAGETSIVRLECYLRNAEIEVPAKLVDLIDQNANKDSR